MKKIYYLLFALLVISSFFFTDKIMIYIDSKNPLMKEIESKLDNYNTMPVNAIIKDNTIIPGISGKNVNKHKSLLKMEDFGTFNEIYLVYDSIKPKISLSDNKDKTIIKGNPNKRSVSLILEKNSLLEDYLNKINIKYDFIANLDSNLTYKREYINGEVDEKNFSDLNSILNKNKINSNICLTNYSNINICKKKNYYIVSSSLDSKENLVDIINKIDSGDIILINSKTSLDNLKLMINEINKLDLKIVYLSELIME